MSVLPGLAERRGEIRRKLSEAVGSRVRLSVRFHGYGPAPSLPPRGAGMICFRVSGDYVSVAPDLPMNREEADAFFAARESLGPDSGISFLRGSDDAGPFEEEAK